MSLFDDLKAQADHFEREMASRSWSASSHFDPERTRARVRVWGTHPDPDAIESTGRDVTHRERPALELGE